MAHRDADGAGAIHPIRFDPRRYTAFDHGYAVTIHKSQGATVDQAFVMASRSMDRHLAYVALTRHRDDLRLALPKDDLPSWGRTHPIRHPSRDASRSPGRAGPSLG